MSEPFVVEVRRRGIIEAVHEVIGCAVDREGHVLASFGDAAHVAYLRSSTKPFQAEPLHVAAPQLASDLMAIACASHMAQPEHLDAVDRLLAASNSHETDLMCGPDPGRPLGRRHNNCSGKHAGMLMACKTNGWSTTDYINEGHPLQQAVLQSLSEKMRVKKAEIFIGIDGCGVPCHGVALHQMALLYAQIEPSIADAMRAYPVLVGGVETDDTNLMQIRPGWTSKRGAEGLLCAQTDSGIGIVLKGIDGSWRGLRPAMSELASRIGLARIDEWDVVDVRNTRGDRVGEISSQKKTKKEASSPSQLRSFD
jgi:L-asparaginase II